MTKNEWFKSFQRELEGLSFDEAQRAIDYYRELYADKADAGMKEKDIIKSFGAPALAAQEILQNGVNNGGNSKDVPPMSEFERNSRAEKDDKLGVLIRRTIGLAGLLFADSIVGSLFFHLLKWSIAATVKAALVIKIGAIFMGLGGTLMIAAWAIMAMRGLIKATIKQVFKIAKGVKI